MSRVIVRALRGFDQAWKVATLERGWGTTTVARLGGLLDAAVLPGFVAEEGDERIGLLTYLEHAGEVEVVTIDALVAHRGVGQALMNAVHRHATLRAATRIWLITTNDNVRAFAFYQQWGMDLRRVVRNGVDASRLLKPSIPAVGSNSLPLRHELEFELVLTS